jgi:hypothetical protein
MTKRSYRYRFILFLIILLCGCNKSDRSKKQFELVPSSKSGINFSNDLIYNEELNTYTYRNFYNGGGVGIGDINNDGLPDIFFVGNQVSNKLYLNKGDFKFDDITQKAGVASEGVWSTGVSMIDINGDGLKDIFVCKSGPPGNKNRHNELFINNGDLTFTEKAKEYGIADEGLSTHATFFDYDRDGDLDLYLLNNAIKSFTSVELSPEKRKVPDPNGANKLYRNNLVENAGFKGNESARKQIFTDVTQEAGIYSSSIGFGLGVSVSDINRDGWPDMYVSNDFFERDYLYINNRDGTFREVLEQYMQSVSLSSMGADIADLNNDGYPEIFVTDMLPESEERLKSKTTFFPWKVHQNFANKGYHYQFTRNTLQLNRGPIANEAVGRNSSANNKIPQVRFSEIGRFANVASTDWSWGALIADFNNDGNEDIFVANGIYKDLTDQDYVNFLANPAEVRKIFNKENKVLKKLVDKMSSNPVPNYMFAGTGGLTFENNADEWGLATPGFSNGSAYGDLDNDGDLDLVVNNVNMEAFVYKNNEVESPGSGNWIEIIFEGTPPNTEAVGAQVTVKAGDKVRWKMQMPIRGFESTVDSRLHIGLGKTKTIDSLMVYWPDGKITAKANVEINKQLIVRQRDAERSSASDHMLLLPKKQDQSLLTEITQNVGINWKHEESLYNDFAENPLLFHMRSTEGPALCKGDINSDGLDDFYVGGAKGQAGAIYIQVDEQTFHRMNTGVLSDDKSSEDTDCIIFDSNGDGFEDLYVASGGSELPSSSSALADRLYFNNSGQGFSRSNQLLPTSRFEPTGTVTAADYDGDGDTDLFVGIRLKPNAVGVPVNGYLLANDGSGNFKNVTEEVAPELKNLGMITSAKWGDLDGDQDPDLFIAGEWMPLRLFENVNNEGKKYGLIDRTESFGMGTSNGWWHHIEPEDLDGDGDLDFVAGNYGMNSFLKASLDEPLKMWVGDFNNDGRIEQIITVSKKKKDYPLALRNNLLEQLPRKESQFPTYRSYAGKNINEIFTPSQLQNAIQLNINHLESMVGWNDGNGNFTLKALPQKAQHFPVYGVLIKDFNDDRKKDLVLGGNLWEVSPQLGRQDAGHGLMLLQTSNQTFKPLSQTQSGINFTGQIRKFIELKGSQKSIILVAENNRPVQFFKLKK